MQVPVLQPAGGRPHRHLRLVYEPTHATPERRTGMLPSWAFPVSILTAFAVVALAVGLTMAFQQSRLNDATVAQRQAEAALTAAQQRESAATAGATSLREQMTQAQSRADAAQARVATLDTRMRAVDANLARAQARLDVSRARITDLASIRSSLEHRLDRAMQAKRVAIANATALTGPPLADGRYTTKFEAVGGTQSPPFAVLHLSGNADWRTVEFAPAAEVQILGHNGPKAVSLSEFEQAFAPGAAHPEDMYRADFRVNVRNDHIQAVTQLH